MKNALKANTPAEREEAKNKLLVLGAVTMLLLAGGVFSGLSSLQRQAVPMTSAEQAEQMKRENKLSVTTPPEALAKGLAHAKVLREKWRPWAEKNKGLLKTMLAAKPDDKTVVAAVWNAIPPLRLEDETSISFKDLHPEGHSNEALFSGATFSWVGLGRVLRDPARLPADPKQRAHIKDIQGLSDKASDFDFRAFHDISIAQSSSRGHQWISLWASGRITQASRTDPMLRRPDEPNQRDPDKELVPPYDFLQ